MAAGDGNSGVKMAIDLAGAVEYIMLPESAPEMKADQVLQNKPRSLKDVDIVLGMQTAEVKGGSGKATGPEYHDCVSGSVHDMELVDIFIQIDLLPSAN